MLKKGIQGKRKTYDYGVNHPNWKGGLIEKECKLCNSLFKSHPSKKRMYCSLECAQKHRPTYRNKEYLKSDNFKRKLSNLKKEYAKLHPEQYLQVSKALSGKKKSIENNLKNSLAQKKRYLENPELRRISSQRWKKLWKEHPELHPNRQMKNISIGQFHLFLFLKDIFYPWKVELEYPIRTKESIRFVDVAIPQFKLDFEYDGIYWHKDSKDLDNKRDIELKEIGWDTIRIEGGN